MTFRELTNPETKEIALLWSEIFRNCTIRSMEDISPTLGGIKISHVAPNIVDLSNGTEMRIIDQTRRKISL